MCLVFLCLAATNVIIVLHKCLLYFCDFCEIFAIESHFVSPRFEMKRFILHTLLLFFGVQHWWIQHRQVDGLLFFFSTLNGRCKVYAFPFAHYFILQSILIAFWMILWYFSDLSIQCHDEVAFFYDSIYSIIYRCFILSKENFRSLDFDWRSRFKASISGIAWSRCSRIRRKTNKLHSFWESNQEIHVIVLNLFKWMPKHSKILEIVDGWHPPIK